MKIHLDLSIQSDTPEEINVFDRIFEKYFDTMPRLESIHKDVTFIKEKVMTMLADFEAFKANVAAGLDTIQTELTEIQADIERLQAASTNTPPEVLASMQALKERVAAIAASATQIANIDNPAPVEPPTEPLVVTPPAEPPPGEPL
jgi:glycyl-tRNA synthetase beta subunit